MEARHEDAETRRRGESAEPTLFPSSRPPVSPSSNLRPAVFLDRDGTLMEEVHYCADPALVRLFPGTAAALRRLAARGFLCVIITNQSGIGRGLLTEAQYHAVQAELLRQLEERRGDAETRRHGESAEPTLSASPRLPISPSSLIAASYFCPDAPPTPSPRRKPEPGMVWEAARDLGIDLARSWFVGDKAADIACGARAGTRTLLVQTGYGAQTAVQRLDPAPDFIVKDIAAAVEVVLQNSDANRP